MIEPQEQIGTGFYFYREKVELENGDIHYEIHSRLPDDDTYVVFEGKNALQNSIVCHTALENRYREIFNDDMIEHMEQTTQ